MKNQLELLLALQELDLEADVIRASRAEIDDSLNEFKQVRDQLEADLERQRQQLEGTIQLNEEKIAEHAEVEERHKRSKSRLSKVSNTKEYAAIELEIETAKRLTAQLEEELVQLMEAIETTRTASAEKETKIEELTEQIDIEETKAQTRITDLEERLEKLTARRGELASQIGKELFRRYSFIRSRRDGVAIVSADNGCCQGCYMQLPPQMFIELQQGVSLKTCPSCQRILYFGAEPESAGDSTD